LGEVEHGLCQQQGASAGVDAQHRLEGPGPDVALQVVVDQEALRVVVHKVGHWVLWVLAAWCSKLLV
jgi:hypothetical protein